MAKVLLIVFLTCYIITSITTIIGCNKYPQASRLLASGNDDNPDIIYLYHSMNIGGFDFVYNLSLLLPLYIAFLKLPDRNVAGRITSRRKKIILFLAFILFLWAIVSAEYTTALLFAIAGTILLFIPIYKVSLKRMAGYFVILAVAFLLVKELIIVNKDFIADIFGSDYISDRIGSLIDIMSGGNSSDNTDLISRFDNWDISIRYFLYKPLFGAATNGGGHSYILDNLADKGLFALIAMVIMYSSVRKKIISPLSSSMFYPYYVIVYSFNIVLGFLNPFNGLLIFTYIIPLHHCYFSQYENTNPFVRLRTDHSYKLRTGPTFAY